LKDQITILKFKGITVFTAACEDKYGNIVEILTFSLGGFMKLKEKATK
jgi:hypothetical protein